LGAIETFAKLPVASTPILSVWMRHTIGNLLVAASFIVPVLPKAAHFFRSPADAIWIVGAVMMGAMSLVRFAPTAARLDVRAFLATLFPVFLLPCLLRANVPSVGMLALIGVSLELIGIALSQVSRLFMGRSFGILPGNRGIVSKGPFHLVRHPIYTGWFLLTLGYLCSYPSATNCIITLMTVPFMMWRIRLEENLLDADPEYREYRRLVPSRIIPGLY
jgi:protein-S-isoprenylcysteine O-methyltransferase Ste14